MIWFPDIGEGNYGYIEVHLAVSLLGQMVSRLIRGGCS
jgi:hypothetical protein